MTGETGMSLAVAGKKRYMVQTARHCRQEAKLSIG